MSLHNGRDVDLIDLSLRHVPMDDDVPLLVPQSSTEEETDSDADSSNVDISMATGLNAQWRRCGRKQQRRSAPSIIYYSGETRRDEANFSLSPSENVINTTQESLKSVGLESLRETLQTGVVDALSRSGTPGPAVDNQVGAGDASSGSGTPGPAADQAGAVDVSGENQRQDGMSPSVSCSVKQVSQLQDNASDDDLLCG